MYLILWCNFSSFILYTKNDNKKSVIFKFNKFNCIFVILLRILDSTAWGYNNLTRCKYFLHIIQIQRMKTSDCFYYHALWVNNWIFILLKII
jgi:hypothetical protein